MLPERDATALEDMLAYAREAAQAAEDRQRDELDTDRFFYLGLQRLIEIIGEAAGRVSRETRERISGIPWPLIIGMRNRLIHGYDIVDPDTLWDTIVADLPPLIGQIESALAREGPVAGGDDPTDVEPEA